MTISYNWLKDYIDIHETPDALGKILTATGLEVESVEVVESVRGGLKGLVIGEVLTCGKHPNADKLSLTTVDVGTGQPAHIVCGASNVAKGQKVVVALPGTTIYPSNGEPFTIRSAKIRGELSEGMICAEDEVGLGENHAGIMVLDKDAVVGSFASEYFKVSADAVLEIGLTPNRADAASHIGVARDLRAARNRAIRWPQVDGYRADNNDLPISVTVESDACTRYSALTITGVKVEASPEWLQQRLRAIGLTPVNNVVDVTNFVLHEIGQPLHAFDADAVKGRRVIVKTLPEGTKFTTLDNKVRSLLSTDLMICNADEGMCIAGVFGGAHSGVTEKTTRIFLESACFAASSVRKTSLHHQLKTDASFRFERGTDPNITVYALKRAALLIRDLAGGKISSEITDVYPKKVEHRAIAIRDANVNRLIGKVIPRAEVLGILKRLDIEVADESASGYTVTVPPYRVDVVQEADIVEEILRIYGFNNIELSNTARTDFLAEFPLKNFDKFKRSLGEMLVGNGFYEIWTNSLTNQSYQQKNNLTFQGEPIEILNKLSEEQGILRQTMLFTGLEVCAHNINRKQRDLKLYEFGKIYFRKDGKYHEQERLALYMTGSVETENWQHPLQAVGYYDLARHVHHICQRAGLNDVRQQRGGDQLFDFVSQMMVDGREIGRAGKVKSTLLKDFGIKQEIFFAELDTSLLFKSANPKLVIQEVVKFPEVKRDLSLVIDAPVIFDEIRNLVYDTERRLIKNVGVFDVYEGENIPKGKKAYALSFTLQDENKTLTDEEIDRTMQQLIAAFERKLGALIRK